jgi:phage head maturation protease
LKILALPFGTAALVRDAGPDGRPMLFREVFGPDSFDNLPERVPLQRMHQRSEPIGWATPRLTAAGVEATAELLDTVRARDSLVEVGAKLMSGVSVGFVADGKRDRWSLPSRPATLPQVHRRGAELVELSLVPKGAYENASVLGTFERDARAHAESEAVLAPLRRAREQQAAARRQSAADLLQWVDQLRAEPVRRIDPDQPPSASAPAEVGTVTLSVGGQLLRVHGTSDVDTAVSRADQAWRHGQLAGRSYGAGAFDLRDYLADHGIELLPRRDTGWPRTG